MMSDRGEMPARQEMLSLSRTPPQYFSHRSHPMSMQVQPPPPPPQPQPLPPPSHHFLPPSTVASTIDRRLPAIRQHSHSTTSLPPTISRSNTEPTWQNTWHDGDWPSARAHITESAPSLSSSSRSILTSSHRRSKSQQIQRHGQPQYTPLYSNSNHLSIGTGTGMAGGGGPGQALPLDSPTSSSSASSASSPYTLTHHLTGAPTSIYHSHSYPHLQQHAHSSFVARPSYPPPPPPLTAQQQQQQQQYQQQHQSATPNGLVGGGLLSEKEFRSSNPSLNFAPSPAVASMATSVARPLFTRSRSLRSESDREEANRQKSKRHYDRKKVQRAALADINGELTQSLERAQMTDTYAFRSALMNDVAQALTVRIPMAEELERQQFTPNMGNDGAVSNQTPVPASASSSIRRANERKRLNKLMQRHLEMQRVQQLSHVARVLEPEVRRYAKMLQMPLVDAKAANALMHSHEWSVDHTLRALYVLLQPWFQCQSVWSHLILAEERLSLMTGRPLARMVTCLRSVVEASQPPILSHSGASSSTSSLHHRRHPSSGTSASTEASH